MADIVIVCPPEGHWSDLARHILTSLGLPQIGVQAEIDPYPKDTHVMVALGPEGWEPQGFSGNIWKFTSDGIVVNPEKSAPCLASLPWGENVDLPIERELTYISYGGSDVAGGDLSRQGLDEALFWAKERLLKGSLELKASEVLEWLLALYFLELQPDREDGIYEVVINRLQQRWQDGARLLAGLSCEGIKLYQSDWHRRLEQVISQLHLKVLKEETLTSDSNDGTPDRKAMLRVPVLIVSHTFVECLQTKGGQRVGDEWVSCLTNILPHASNAPRLVALSIAGSLSGQTALSVSVENVISRPEWRASETTLTRISPGGTSLHFTPFAAVRHFFRLKNMEAQFDVPLSCGSEHQANENLKWVSLGGVGAREPVGGIAISTISLIDKGRCEISRSLLDNWLNLHSASCPTNRKFLLKNGNYVAAIRPIETVWVGFFRWLQAKAGRPLVRLLPWPAGKTAAFSLRYDVDRPVTKVQFKNIVAIQKKYLKEGCATWYYFPNDPNRNSEARRLRKKRQEIGLHLEKAEQALNGFGTTHHSAATSEYWRGNSSIRQLNERGALYGEFLATQIVTPRPCWLAAQDSQQLLPSDPHNDAGQIGRMWMTPLHFPLEGSTRDTTLDYFDKLKVFFREMFEIGGHVIICSHPDLTQDIMEELIQREDLSGVWIASVDAVVERCQKILGLDNIEVLPGDARRKEMLTLRSNCDIDQLAVEIYPSDGGRVVKCSVDLKKGQYCDFSISL